MSGPEITAAGCGPTCRRIMTPARDLRRGAPAGVPLVPAGPVRVRGFRRATARAKSSRWPRRKADGSGASCRVWMPDHFVHLLFVDPDAARAGASAAACCGFVEDTFGDWAWLKCQAQNESGARLLPRLRVDGGRRRRQRIGTMGCSIVEHDIDFRPPRTPPPAEGSHDRPLHSRLLRRPPHRSGSAPPPVPLCWPCSGRRPAGAGAQPTTTPAAPAAPPIRIIIEVPNDDAGRAFVNDKLVPKLGADVRNAAGAAHDGRYVCTASTASPAKPAGEMMMPQMAAEQLNSVRDRGEALVMAVPRRPGGHGRRVPAVQGDG